ncbi:tetratricopeptide repeat protein [bacterium]|nr:tetratricopeptide repeat protein [bacterium]
MGVWKEMFYSKKVLLPLLILAVVTWSVSFWYGGRKKREVTGFFHSAAGDASLSAAFEKKLKDKPDDPILKYNLAFFYYQQNRYEDAARYLREILSSSYQDLELVQKVSFNLGNALFRISEQTADHQQAVEQLKKVLVLYRAVIENEREQQRYVNGHREIEADARFNYAVTKKRIKILLDQLEKEKEQQQKKKELFVLIKDLLAAEKQIKAQLEAISSIPESKQSNEQRVLLLKKRAQNFEQLTQIKERVRQMIQSQTSPPPTPPTI